VTPAAPAINPRVLLAFEPPDGGVAENAMQLALGLGAHGFEVEVAGPLEAIVYPRMEAAGVPIHRLPFRRGYGRPLQDAAGLAALVRLLRSRRYALVHCHSAKAGVLGRIAAALTRVPVVYSPHSLPFVGDFSELRRRFATLTERALAPATAALLCVCEAERRIALEHRLGPPERVRVVYNGCEPCPDGVEVDPALARLRAEGPVAAAVTVLREQKRPDIFLEAVPMVLERVPGARLALVGDGPLREELHARATELGLDEEPRFAFLPFAPPAARHLRAMDVYVLPSAWEAFPIGVLEALACGTPQVATDVGGTGEAVVPETGVLVPPRDAAALAAAVADLLGDAERRARMSQASRERHAERFGVERMVAETAALYRDVLSR
jgi:glycosyltransferase involved in cell wall biosynthesis